MSGQWEVVGKSKKDKVTGKSKKLSKNDKKKFVDNAPKVEDLLPLAQVKSLYAALDSNKEPVKPVEKVVKTKEKQTNEQKKTKAKKPTVVKENKPPKTTEAAAAQITVEGVRIVLDLGDTLYNSGGLIGLKSVVSWLNTSLPIDHMDNAFTAKSWEYPLCLLKAEIRNELKKALKDLRDSALQTFYDYCLTSMANDMTKGSPVSGYKMMLQLVASQSPSVTVADVGKNASLRHSYQNRPAIGCSIMWALGQAGFKDLSVGLQVWQQVMFPVLELRHYTQFVSDYLKHLLARHSTSKALTAQQYLDILDMVCSSPRPQLSAHLRSLQEIVCNVEPNSRLHTLFEPLLSRLNSQNSPILKTELVGFLMLCLTEDKQSYPVWRQLYTRYLPHSAMLLKHLNAEWSSLAPKLPTKMVKDTIKTFKVTNDDMIKHKQKAVGLQECSCLCDALISKMSEGKSFPWKRLIFIIVLAVAGVVTYDFKLHGTFKGSKTGVFLRDVGALNYLEHALARVNETSQVAYRWGEHNMPVHWAKVKEVTGPTFVTIADLARTLALQVTASAKLFAQYCSENVPLWMNHYAPGLTESLSLWLSQAWDVTRDYGLQGLALALKYLSLTFEWLRENVFVGRLSPENLQRVTLEALNTTQMLAAQTFSWINSKVITEPSNSVQ